MSAVDVKPDAQGEMPPEAARTVAGLLLDYLKLEGVKTLFGIPGGAIIYLISELKARADEFQFVICRHETGAAYLAHGYAAVTGGLGVVLTTSGPAASNALTGAVNAQASCVPLLVITGEIAQKYYGQGYLQEGVDAKLDITSVYQSAVQYSAIVSSPSNVVTLFQQALREARSLPNRTSHLSLPNDVAGMPMPQTSAPPASTIAYRATPSGTDALKVGETFDELLRAKRPLFFLGNGCRQALADPERRKAFTAFIETFAIPVMTTPDAKGVFSENHPLSLRSYGLCGCPWTGVYTDQSVGVELGAYDALLVLGSSLGELATTVAERDPYAASLIPKGPFVHVDLDQSVIGREFPVTRGIVAEVGATIDELCRLGSRKGKQSGKIFEARRQFVAWIKAEHAACDRPDWYASDARPVNPAALMRVLNEEITRGHVFIDAGNCVGWSLNYMIVEPPVAYHSALSMGPMGFAVGAVVGAKLGAPDEPCIAIVGDGAFMMHGAEISTAAQSRVGAIWIVLNDNDLSMVSQGMASLFGSTSWDGYYKLGAPDLVLFAKGLGAHAVAVSPEQGPEAFRAELKRALERSKSGEPQVIVAHIDPVPTPPYGWPHLS